MLHLKHLSCLTQVGDLSKIPSRRGKEVNSKVGLPGLDSPISSPSLSAGPLLTLPLPA